jgi:Fe-S-cluster containining protein
VNNQIKKENLYTIRRGELVRDNITDGLVVTHTELIKIKERDGETRGCVFYDEAGKACTIYAHRPVQCSAFKCWDTDEFMKAYKGPKLMREQVVEDGVLLGLIEEHERRCSYAVLEEHAREIESKGEEVVERILDLLKFEYHLRPFICEKLGLNPDEMDFFFGRPLIKTITMFGLRVIREPEGSFLLTTLK